MKDKTYVDNNTSYHLSYTYCVPGTVLGPLPVWPLVLTVALKLTLIIPCFTNEATEAQKG